MPNIIARAALRVMVGVPGLRNERYQEASRAYANAVLMDSTLINCTPPFLRPVLGPALGMRVKHHKRKLMKIPVPIAEEKMRQCGGKDMQDDPVSLHSVLCTCPYVPHDYSFQGDVIHWMIGKGKSHGPEQQTALKIAKRIMSLTSMFIFGIGWIYCWAVLDVYGSPCRSDFIHTLEAECRRVSDHHGGLSTKAAVDALHHLDFNLRESMRLNDINVLCQPGTLVHKVNRELHPHVTLSYLLTHLGCVYNRSM
jgi:hypothetical protein